MELLLSQYGISGFVLGSVNEQELVVESPKKGFLEKTPKTEYRNESRSAAVSLKKYKIPIHMYQHLVQCLVDLA